MSSTSQSKSRERGERETCFLTVHQVTGLLNALLLLGLGKKFKPQTPMRAKGSDVPHIDIFLPCYGEGVDIIKDTVLAAIHQDYPKDRYRVIVLDDGNSKDVRKLVTQIAKDHPSSKLHYAARGAEIRIHSKAANINFGLDLVKSFDGGPAPYFGVLDIDMIPTAVWLRSTIPFLLEDEGVALAGSPQKFYNLPKGFTLATRFHLETDVIQRLFDSQGKALCMGSGYLARRDTIESLGGFPAMIKQEDTFIVSIILQAHGHRTRLLEEEHQHGLYALTYTDISRAHTKWMTGIIHAYTLLTHPIMAGKSFGVRFQGVFPILHLTLLRLFMMLSLPTILLLASNSAVPDCGGNELTVVTLLAFLAYSSTYLLSWILSEAANGTVSLDDGQRMWHLPYQLRGLLWLAKHAIFGDTALPRFTTTGADTAATRLKRQNGRAARLYQTVVRDGAWMHLIYFAALSTVLYRTLSSHLPLDRTSVRFLATSIAFPPFTKILLECLYQALIPIQYVLSPDPNDVPRESLLERDEKTGVARPTQESITPPQPPFWGNAGSTGWMWLYFGLVPTYIALQSRILS